MHQYDAIPSTSHQVLKAIWRRQAVKIPFSTNPFDIEETHLADVVFFNEFNEEFDEEMQSFRPIALPCWEEIVEDKPESS